MIGMDRRHLIRPNEPPDHSIEYASQVLGYFELLFCPDSTERLFFDGPAHEKYVPDPLNSLLKKADSTTNTPFKFSDSYRPEASDNERRNKNTKHF